MVQENNEEVVKLTKYLRDKDADFDDIYEYKEEIYILVSWGDWKHSHLYLNSLMNEIGYISLGEEVTEENGSDCYSSIHIFKKI